jgi:hypothetical protein
MAKFTLSLRKSLAARFSRIDSGSEISSSLVDHLASLEDSDVRPPQDSSDTLPSSFGETKSKQFFSFRRKDRRSALALAQLVEESNARSIGLGSLRLRGGAKSNQDTQKSLSKSEKAPPFVGLFLRRSTPSLRIKSDASSPCLPDGPTPTIYPRDAQSVIGEPGLLGRHDSSTLADISSPSESNADTPISSDSKNSDKIVSWSTLPIPPIIISSPTPPDALWLFADESNIAQEQGHLADSETPFDIEDLEERTNFSHVPMVVKTLQSATRQLANDPGVTQGNIFQLSAPITAFLYILGIGVIILKKEIFSLDPDRKASQIAVCIIAISVGMLLVLALLRGIIWVMSKLGRSFCELDLEEVFARGIFVDSGEHLTETDFIVGNLIS